MVDLMSRKGRMQSIHQVKSWLKKEPSDLMLSVKIEDVKGQMSLFEPKSDQFNILKDTLHLLRQEDFRRKKSDRKSQQEFDFGDYLGST